jgi:hypothetical protein
MTHPKRPKSGYDKNDLDIAVNMVLQNKLSLRAASHIYKIPFSTLRTRKICMIILNYHLRHSQPGVERLIYKLSIPYHAQK